MVVSDEGLEKVTLVNKLQPENAELPIEVTEPGIVIAANFEQPENVELLIAETKEGEAKLKLVNPLQF